MMGFQRDDPTSDFRGMGMLGLDHLLYIAEHRRDRFRKIMERHKSVGGQIEHSYPLASAGINVTNMLIGILTITPSRLPNFHDSASEDPLWASLLLPFLTYCEYQPGESSHVLEEIYCEVLILLDRTFEAQNAGYMDFPRILESTKKRLLELLARKPRSLSTLRAWFDQLNLGFQQ
jgi:ELMO domain-containing protein